MDGLQDRIARLQGKLNVLGSTFDEKEFEVFSMDIFNRTWKDKIISISTRTNKQLKFRWYPSSKTLSSNVFDVTLEFRPEKKYTISDFVVFDKKPVDSLALFEFLRCFQTLDLFSNARYSNAYTLFNLDPECEELKNILTEWNQDNENSLDMINEDNVIRVEVKRNWKDIFFEKKFSRYEGIYNDEEFSSWKRDNMATHKSTKDLILKEIEQLKPKIEANKFNAADNIITFAFDVAAFVKNLEQLLSQL